MYFYICERGRRKYDGEIGSSYQMHVRIYQCGYVGKSFLICLCIPLFIFLCLEALQIKMSAVKARKIARK